MSGSAKDVTQTLALFGALSLGAVLTGAYVCHLSGVPSALMLRNIVAWAIGAVLALAISFTPPRALPYLMMATPIVLIAPFLSPGMQGVHRWIDAGPLHINAAMLVLPLGIVALAALARTPRWPVWTGLAALALVALQPDRSQAIAWAAALLATGVLWPQKPTRKVLSIGGAVLFVAAAWLQPDALAPVPEVEGIVALAAKASPALAALAVVLLIATAAAPALATWKAAPTARLAGRALSVLFLGWIVTPLLGAFPVPWVGIGLSPILGAWLGVGLLTALVRRSGQA